jgi:hypothetical protein
MMIQKFWRKRALVIGAAIFLLTLVALDLNALVFQGKAGMSEAQAFLGIHLRHAQKINGQTQCPNSGWNCLVIDWAPGQEITIPLL